MANLELIKTLNAKYKKDSPILKTKIFSFDLNEALDVRSGMEKMSIEKGIASSIAKLGVSYTRYFELGLPANVALLFVDVCGFSTRFVNLNGKQIAEFFDEYYNIVIPIIYKYGGEVDKIMGDGIVCVFGPPFMENYTHTCVKAAKNCSKALIEATSSTKFKSKVALHFGEINYYKNKTGLYNEFTMIGKPLTELFRLEGVSEDNAINYYGDTKIDEGFNIDKIVADLKAVLEQPPVKGDWKFAVRDIVNLKGVNYSKHYACYQHK